MIEKFSTRDATRADAAAIARIYNTWIDQGNATMDLVHWSADSVGLRLDGLEPRESCLVIANGADVLGWGTIRTYSPKRGYRVSCETSIYLDKTQLGKGLGGKLLNAVFDRCRSLGYRHAVAKIIASNTASIEFHRRHGFELVGIQNEVGYKQGRWWNVAIMQKLFADVAPPVDDHDDNDG